SSFAGYMQLARASSPRLDLGQERLGRKANSAAWRIKTILWLNARFVLFAHERAEIRKLRQTKTPISKDIWRRIVAGRKLLSELSQSRRADATERIVTGSGKCHRRALHSSDPLFGPFAKPASSRGMCANERNNREAMMDLGKPKLII